MPNKNTILFSDINKKGIPGIIYYDKITKDLSVLYKASNPSTKLELCLFKEDLFLGEFGLDRMYAGSIISRLKTKTIDFSKREIIYESSLNDLGNIQCRDRLMFIRNLSKEREKLAYEVVEYVSKDKSPKVLSDIKFASHMIDMDGVLLLPHLGKYYVLKGISDFTKIDNLKKKKKEGALE